MIHYHYCLLYLSSSSFSLVFSAWNLCVCLFDDTVSHIHTPHLSCCQNEFFDSIIIPFSHSHSLLSYSLSLTFSLSDFILLLLYHWLLTTFPFLLHSSIYLFAVFLRIFSRAVYKSIVVWATMIASFFLYVLVSFLSIHWHFSIRTVDTKFIPYFLGSYMIKSCVSFDFLLKSHCTNRRSSHHLIKFHRRLCSVIYSERSC